MKMKALVNVADAKEAATYSAAGPEPNILLENEQIKVIAAGLEAGQAIPAHPEALAVYHILEGEGQMTVDGEPIAVGPGPTIVTPAGSTRGMTATTRLSFLAKWIA
jgi:quercetin dioxygenase-like cupin family protein